MEEKKEKVESLGKIGKKLVWGSSFLVLLTVILEAVSFYYAIKFGSLIAIILSTLIALMISLVATDLIAHSIIYPIKSIYLATKEIEKRNFSARVELESNDELNDLGDSFNKMAEALGKIDEEYKRIDKAKTEFLSITSHELRSPMTPMKAQLQMLIEGYYGNLTKNQKDSIEMVLRNTNRLDNIIVDFLEISRIEAARLKFRFVKTDIKEISEKLVDEMKNFLPEKKITIVINFDKIPKIEADPDRVTQVLRNLLNNAKKFSPDNSPIVVSAELEGKYILFKVKDRGIGIAKENLDKIFEPFYQEEQTMYRKYGGTGLGLTICKGIIESQNGKIWAESEKGKGSTFYFTVPITPLKEPRPIKASFSSIPKNKSF